MNEYDAKIACLILLPNGNRRFVLQRISISTNLSSASFCVQHFYSLSKKIIDLKNYCNAFSNDLTLRWETFGNFYPQPAS